MVHTFAQTPAVEKLIIEIALRNKQSIASNASKPKIAINSSLGTMLPKHIIESALAVRLNASAIKASYEDKDSKLFKSSCTSNRQRLGLEARKLAKKYAEFSKDTHVVVHSEFRASFHYVQIWHLRIV